MSLNDEQLQQEAQSQRLYIERLKRSKVPMIVVARAEMQLDMLDELMLWRQNGKKWLESLNKKPDHDSKSGTLSDSI